MTVFEKTAELGQAILASEQYKAMKAAEQVLENDDLCQAHIAQYTSIQQAISNLLETGENRVDEINTLNQRAIAIREALLKNDTFLKAQQTAQDFQTMVNQVNQVLRFMITGETDDSCSPDQCASCGGACHK